MPERSSSRLLLASHVYASLAGTAVGALLVGALCSGRLLALGRSLSHATGWPHVTSLVLVIGGVIIVTALILLVAVALLAFNGTSELRARLSTLADASALFAAGRLQYRIDLPGDDDLALTANRLNAMARTLQEQVRALQDAADDNAALRKDAVVAATIQERARVQRELHDRVSQNLFGLTLLCTAAEAKRMEDPEAALSLLPELTELAKRTQGALRSLLLELRPKQLGERNLASAIHALAEELSMRTGVPISCLIQDDQLSADREALAHSVEDALFLIAQEGLLNALRHASARMIGIELYIERERVVLRIFDDGIGFAQLPEAGGAMADNLTSVGLQSMRERAQLIGGSCLFSNRDEGGAQVLAVIPRV